MHYATPQHTSTSICALKGGMPTLSVDLVGTHRHQPNPTGSVINTASLRFYETTSGCNSVGFNAATLAAAAPEQSRGGAPGHRQVLQANFPVSPAAMLGGAPLSGASRAP